MKKVKVTLRGGGALEWTPRNQTKNILGLWNWMSRTQNDSSILNFIEGGVRISEIAAMEYIEEPEEVELSFVDNEQYQEIRGIVYATGEEPIKDINSFARIDVYPNLSSLVNELGLSSKKELTAKKYVFAEITCRVPFDDFERFEKGERIFANRRSVTSEPTMVELSYKLVLGWLDEYEYIRKGDSDGYTTVYATETFTDNGRQVYSLVPVTSSSLEENGAIIVPCCHVTRIGSEDS